MWLTFILISSLGWSIVNVFDSMLVKRYRQPPVVMMWSQSLFTVSSLVVVALLFDVRTTWYAVLLLASAGSYIADITFFSVLKRLDVSVTNAAWALLSLFLSMGGFVLFNERWNTLQSMGALLIIGSVLALSFWNRYVSIGHTFVLLAGLALLYTPYYLVKKAAIDDGQTVIAVFFWLLVIRESIAFLLPWFVPTYRRSISSLIQRKYEGFFTIGAGVVAFFFIGEYFSGLAYSVGSLSLVAIVSNIQPFIVICLAGLLDRFVPSLAPKEVLTAHSIHVKLLCFLGVFLGLALLSVS